MMNKNLKWISVYLILNLVLIIIPQSQKNCELKASINEDVAIEIIPQIKSLTDQEFINKIEAVLENQNSIEKNYTYNKQSLEFIDIYEVELNLKGEKTEINKFIKILCKTEYLNMSELICDYEKSPSEANIKLISMGGKNE